MIPGQNGNSLTLGPLSLADSGTYCVSVTGACNSVESCADLLVVSCDEVHCSFTQGFWGNPGGYWNGISTPDLMTSLLMAPDGSANPLTVGVLGMRSMTIGPEDVDCVVLRLPAGGRASALWKGALDDVELDDNCDAGQVRVRNNGRWRNVLLGQTVALSLNVRLDPGLADVELCASMTTILMGPGPDGILGTEDDEPDPGPDGLFGTADDTFEVNIPEEVLLLLDSLGGRTVANLLELANASLAGAQLDVSHSAINDALDAINVGFDECRLAIDCAD